MKHTTKKKLLKIYLNIFSVLCFFSSALFVYDLIAKLNLPRGIASSIVNYGYFLVHIFSYIGMLHYFHDNIQKNKEM